jgi:hypothetical protein
MKVTMLLGETLCQYTFEVNLCGKSPASVEIVLSAESEQVRGDFRSGKPDSLLRFFGFQARVASRALVEGEDVPSCDGVWCTPAAVG